MEEATSGGKGKLFLGYNCAISIASKKHLAATMRILDIPHITLQEYCGREAISRSIFRGWINYYGRFRISMLNPIFQLLRRHLVQWARKRYKRYKTSINKAYDWLKRIREQFPYLYYQWRLGF